MALSYNNASRTYNEPLFYYSGLGIYPIAATATVGTTVARTRVVNKNATITQATSTTVRRVVSKNATIVSTTALARTRTVSKSASITSALTVTSRKDRPLEFSLSVGTSAVGRRVVNLNRTAPSTTAVTRGRTISKSATVTQATAVARNRIIQKRATAASTLGVVLRRDYTKSFLLQQRAVASVRNPRTEKDPVTDLAQAWVNPLRNAMTTPEGLAIAGAFDSLESYLSGPLYAPQGLVLGNGGTLGTGAVPSLTMPFGPDSVPPGAVTNLTIVGGVKAIIPKWDKVSDLDVYRYEVTVSESPSFTSPIQVFAGGATTVVTGLTYGTTYYVRVRAIDQWGNVGTWSSTVSGTPVQVGTADIVTGSVTTDLLFANAVTADKIATNAIETRHIKADQIDANMLKANAVTANAIAANAVTAAKIATGSITADKIVAGTITATQISIGGITAATIADLAVTEAKIGAYAVSAEKIAALAVSVDKLAANSVSADKVQTGAITAGKIAADAVTATEIAAGTITATEIAANTITAGQIAANAITASELAAITMEVGKYIHSSNYVNGSAGWAIDADGNAEFNDVTIRGGLLVNGEIEGASVTAGRIQSPDFNPATPFAAGWGIDYLGGAYFNEGHFQGKVAAGSITSNVYTAGSAGWTIDADGNAEFNDVTVRGTVAASTVQGSQIYGSSFVLTAGYSGQRVEMLSSVPNQISFYTGDSGGDYGYLRVTSDYVEIGSPVDSGSVSHIYMYSSGDDPSYSDTHIVMDANYVSGGTFVADAYLNTGRYHGATSGAAAKIQMVSSNEITFGWDGTDITFYVDGIGVKTL